LPDLYSGKVTDAQLNKIAAETKNTEFINAVLTYTKSNDTNIRETLVNSITNAFNVAYPNDDKRKIFVEIAIQIIN